MISRNGSENARNADKAFVLLVTSGNEEISTCPSQTGRI